MGRMDADVATSFTASLPPWLVEELPALTDAPPLATPEERVRLVNRLADRNWRAGNGGPFAAAVVDAASGALVSVGVNVVLQENLSTVHAEMMALSLAHRRLGRWDLGADGADLELVVNWRPCVMCYGATMWSGVRSLAIAGAGAEVERAHRLRRGPDARGLGRAFERRGIRVSVGIGHDEAIEVFRAFGASDAVVYNARGASEG